MKILVCCESELVLQMAGMALEAAGLQAFVEREAQKLVAQVPGAQALLVDAARAKQAAALLRDRGFAGRALLLADGTPEELGARAQELGLDGAVPATPPEELAGRLTAALGARRRVLIVDDSEIVARLLTEELTGKGFEIQYAPDAEKAVSVIMKRQTRPDLILLDINMPKVDGAQFCRFVKKNAMFKGIKVIFCSGEEREKVKRLAAECGADGFILKDEYLGKWIAENG